MALLFFLRAADWSTNNFLEMLLFSCNPIGQLCVSGHHCKGKIHPLEFFLESFSKSWNFLEELEQKLLLLHSRLHSSLVQRNENLGQFTLFTETIMYLVCPPKFYVIFVSSFSWEPVSLRGRRRGFGREGNARGAPNTHKCSKCRNV